LTDNITSQTEEFLESIYRLQERDGVAKTSNLVRMLRVAPGTVTNTVERLEKRGLVTHETYRGVKLSEEGRTIALAVLRRHRLSERLLTDVLRMDWDQVHEAACRLEHGITEEVAQNIENMLEGPQTCPHGNPIPPTHGGIAEERTQMLLELKDGEAGIATRITDEGNKTLQRLEILGLRLGVSVEVVRRDYREGTVTVKIDGTEHVLGSKIASVIRVRRLGEDSYVGQEVEEWTAKTEE